MIGPALVAGGAFGAKHAVEADHVAAVATLVDNGADRPGIVGAAWGIGHAVPILAVGGLFVLLGLQLPAAVGTAFEAIVGLVLLALGARVMTGRPALVEHVHSGGDADNGETEHGHLRIGPFEVGRSHAHVGPRSGSFGVGIVHGLAGSGGLVVALAATAPTARAGIAYLLAFAAASILTMALGAGIWGRLVDRLRGLRRVAGVISVAVGGLLLLGIAGVPTPL